jgi:hypothetical protein
MYTLCIGAGLAGVVDCCLLGPPVCGATRPAGNTRHCLAATLGSVNQYSSIAERGGESDAQGGHWGLVAWRVG